MSRPYDAVVVGAGPAGSAAAIALGQAGRRVLLLDRQVFPRDKPCGDLIGARAMTAAKRLGVAEGDLDGFARLTGATITADGGALDLVPRTALGRALLGSSDARVVPRMVFDHLLVRHAVGCGADVRQATVRNVDGWDGQTRIVRIELAGKRDEIAAKAVIIAGGYGCRVAADLAPRDREDGPPRGIAMRGYFRGLGSPVDRIVFALDRWLLPGYGWIFPLPGGGANVGVGRLAGAGQREQDGLEELWRRFTEDKESPAAAWLGSAIPVGPPRSWPLDLGPRRRRLVGDGLLVAGEAAGFVGPLTGAGIAFALESGERAGQAVAAALTAGDCSRAHLREYGAAMRHKLAPWLRAELLAQRLLSDSERVDALFGAVRPLPMTSLVGAWLLLHLG